MIHYTLTRLDFKENESMLSEISDHFHYAIIHNRQLVEIMQILWKTDK